MDLRAVQRGSGVGEVTDAGRDAGLLHAVGERVEVRDLTFGGFHELGNVGTVGHGQVAPLTDDLDHALLGQRHQLGQCRVETFRGEAVAAEPGVDLHMHAGGLAQFAGGCGDGVDARQRADRHVDIVVDQFVEGHGGAVVHPGENVATVGADAQLAQQQRLMGLRGAKPGGAAGQRCQCRGKQSMAVGVGFDHSHDGGAGLRSSHGGDKVTHIVAHRLQIDDRLRRVLAAGGFIIGFALFG